MSNNLIPIYQCTKQVQALKISNIDLSEEDIAIISFEKEEFSPKTVERVFYDKFHPEVGGYLVYYIDGYLSYSPAHAFENGYILLEKYKEKQIKISESLDNIERILNTTRKYIDVTLVKGDILKEVLTIKELMK